MADLNEGIVAVAEIGRRYVVVGTGGEGDYSEYMAGQERLWEQLCRRCGGCCGAFEDPCSQLRKDATGGYYCAVYAERFGERESLFGKKFNCVPVRQILHKHWANDHLCAYKQKLRFPWTV